MGTTRAAEEVPVLLAYAREQLRRGDVDAAASVLRSLGNELTDDQAMQTAELLIAARLLVEATDLAVTIAGDASSGLAVDKPLRRAHARTR